MVLLDQNDREKALDVQRSCIVQAPAGSGKTTLLTKRFLNLLAYAVDSPEEILALTFTKKAAGEMKTRILATLNDNQDKLVQKVLEKSKIKKWALNDNPNRLKIMTIDSHCASLVKQMPLLSRLGAHNNISQFPEMLYQQASENLFNDLRNKTSYQRQLEIVLMHCDNEPNKVVRLFALLLSKREMWADVLLGLDETHLTTLFENNLREISKALIDTLEASLPEFFWNQTNLFDYAKQNLEPAIRESGKNYDWFNWKFIASTLLTASGEFRKTLTKKQGFPSCASFKTKEEKELSKINKQSMLNLIEVLSSQEETRRLLNDILLLPSCDYESHEKVYIESLLSLLPILLAHLTLVFKEQGQVDYTEIAMQANHALGDDLNPTDLALLMDYKIKHLLVDEFQDTSLMQFEYLTKLTRGFALESNRTVFFVGDPMQSIYRFREARVGLFLQVQERGFNDLYLEKLFLKENFRSAKKIVEWNNQVFQTAFPQQQEWTSGQVTYHCAVSNTEKPRGQVQVFLSESEYEPLIEANEIVKIIQKTQNITPEASIAILVRSRNDLSAILPALNKAKVAFEGVDIYPLGETLIVRDLLTLTKALLNFNDTIAWMSLLRAPFVGLETIQIYHLVHLDCSVPLFFNLTKAIKSELFSVNTKLRIQCFLETINQALLQKDRIHFDLLLETTWKRFNADLCYSKSELDNKIQFFEILNYFSKLSKNLMVKSLEAQLKKLFAANQSSDTNSVKIMTIHKAKGLEFDVVLLPSIGKSLPVGKQELFVMDNFLAKDHEKILFAPMPAAENNVNSLYHFVKAEQNKREALERTRLLYVACTRAKSELYLLGHVDKEQKQPKSNSLLAHVWEGIQDHSIKPSIHIMDSEIVENAKEIVLPCNRIKRLKIECFKVKKEKGNLENPTDKTTDLEPLNTRLFYSLVGQVVHLAFYAKIIHGEMPTKKVLTNWLEDKGLEQKELKKALHLLEKAIKNTLQDAKGQWILNAAHENSKAEWSLTYSKNNETQECRLDRTFVFEGAQWIIDYKVVQQAEILPEYLQQLNHYKKILRDFRGDNLPIRTGLYFPLQAKFECLEFITSEKEAIL